MSRSSGGTSKRPSVTLGRRTVIVGVGAKQTRQRIIAALLESNTGELRPKDIATSIGKTANAVQQELGKMLEDGVVKSDRHGW